MKRTMWTKRTVRKDENRARGAFWKPQPGENVVRVLTWEHPVNHTDMRMGRYDPAEVSVGDTVEEFALPYRHHFFHRKVCGQVESYTGELIGECDICRLREKLRYSEMAEDKDAYDRTRTNTRYAIQITDIMADDGIVHRWDAPRWIYNMIIEQYRKDEQKGREGREYVGVNGRDIEFTYQPRVDKKPGRYESETFCELEDNTDLSGQVFEVVDLHMDEYYIPESFRDDEEAEEEKPKAKAKGKGRSKKAAPKKEEPPAFVFDEGLKGRWFQWNDEGVEKQGQVVSAPEEGHDGVMYVEVQVEGEKDDDGDPLVYEFAESDFAEDDVVEVSKP